MLISPLNPQNKTKGVTLVELMIAIVISAVLVLGIGEIFKLNKRSYQTQDDSARMQESGRFAFNLIMQDIRRAGYYGGNADTANITGTSGIIAPTNSCPNDTTWGRMLERRIIGLNDNNTGYACIPNADYSLGDILVMRYTQGANVTDATMDLAANDDTLYIRSSMFEGRLFIGDDRANAANTVAETPNSVQALAAQAYYVGKTARTCRFNNADNTTIPITALYRETLSNTGVPIQEEVANSIEDLQVQYGIDDSGDGSVNQYFDADDILNTTATPNWTQVVAVRFWVLARAECPTSGYTNSKTYVMGDKNFTPADEFKRQLYSSTVSLRNGS